MSLIALDRRTTADRIADALRRGYGNTKSAIKEISRAAFANERTAENWWDGKCVPNGTDLIELMRDSDEVLNEVLEMAGRGSLAELARIRAVAQDLRRTLDGLETP